jgi:hypothetical protein
MISGLIAILAASGAATTRPLAPAQIRRDSRNYAEAGQRVGLDSRLASDKP